MNQYNETDLIVQSILNQTNPPITYHYYQQKLKETDEKQMIIENVINNFTNYINKFVQFEDIEIILKHHIIISNQINILMQIYWQMDYELKSQLQSQLKNIYKQKMIEQKQIINDKIFQRLLILRSQSYSDEIQNIIQFVKDIDLNDNIFSSNFLQITNQIYSNQKTVDDIYNLYNSEIKILELIDDDEIIEQINQQLKLQIQKIIEISPILITNDNYSSKLYILNKVIQSNNMKGKLYDLIFRDITSIITNEQQSNQIENIMKLKNHYLEFIKNTCQDDGQFLGCLYNSLESGILQKVNVLSEKYSFYLDSLMIKIEENKNENNNILQIKKALELLRFFSAKDIFEHFYTQRMTKRLLLELSLSLDLEIEVIQIMKQQCGDQYVRKAEEVLKEFKKAYNFDYKGIQVKVIVISQNSWTLKSEQLPLEFLQEQKQYFIEQNTLELKQKQLLWLHECSNCQIKGFSKYTFQVSAIQALILDYFNYQNNYTIQNLIEKSKLSKDEILRNLIPLEKEKILIKQQNQFVINDQFQSNRTYKKINQIQKIEKKEDIDETTQKMLHDRKYIIDASIVKIMKRDKQHTLNEIINLVLQDLSLPIQNMDVKQQIEVLTEKEYLIRDINDITLFKYQA